MKKYLKEMNFLKDEKDITDKGITLIALVVTIVVLLILASVSITVVFGDNGLIEMAREAGRKTNEAVEKEQGDIANLTNDIKDYVNGTSRGKTLVQMFKDGELKVGDYISYENPTEGSYTAEAERTGMDRAGVEGITSQTFSVANNPLHWRVLGIDKETGGLKLIAGRPIKSDRVNVDNDPYFYMYGANMYEYGKEELDNISGIFMNEKYAEKVRSVTIDDINEAVGIETEEDIKQVSSNEDYGKTYSFDNQYTPKSWLEDLKEVKEKPEAVGSKEGQISEKVNEYYYTINSEEDPTVKVKDQTLLNMLFDNVENRIRLW